MREGAPRVLGDLAVQMTSQGAVMLEEMQALRAVSLASDQLKATRQIESSPEPSEILHVLCAHHVLERLEHPAVAFRFQHQQFQERYVSLRLKRQLLELAENKGLDIEYRQIRKLARILVRSTIGFGMIEVLLMDPKVQDITINSPVGRLPMFIVHADYGECVTNVIPSQEDSEGWATKFRLLSARPLDEANPVLDIDLEVPGARARVAAITSPLNPFGFCLGSIGRRNCCRHIRDAPCLSHENHQDHPRQIGEGHNGEGHGKSRTFHKGGD